MSYRRPGFACSTLRIRTFGCRPHLYALWPPDHASSRYTHLLFVSRSNHPTLYAMLSILYIVCGIVRVTQPLRCFEQAGTRTFNKPELLAMAKGCVRVVQRSGLVGSSLVFRRPQQADPDSGLTTQPSVGWLNWEALRDHLPEFAGDAIIIAWLRKTGSLVGETGRVLYRGMERVLDLGALGWLSAKMAGSCICD